ncbi:MAG TPA: hypothetical protein VH277_15440, partial [Gemmatimonadaceae bacterium]|nr:hypothetical protein [Gemmatimonadaceae bacterium]
MTDATKGGVLAALQSLPASDLLAWLARQRWFGAKGGAPSSARVVDAVELPWGDGAYAVARAAVELSGGEHQTYQLVVSNRGGEDAIGGRVGEAARDEDFRRGLIDALGRGASAESNGLRWIAEPLGSITLPGTSKVGSAEQSNTSIIIGDQGILKLFRMLKPGVQPDVEVTSFLTRAGFPNTPKLLGTIRLERGDEVTTVGMLQAYLSGSSDAWSYALDRGRAYFTAPIDSDPGNNF